MPTNRVSDIANEVRSAAARSQKSQTQLAEALGTTQVAISRRMRGAVPFTGAELDALAVYLDVPITTFFPEADVRTGTGG
jgi:transcriptional regulator with XRE-family HTH domain